MNDVATIYQPPWYFRNGMVQTLVASYWYSTAWRLVGEKAWWLSQLPPIPWQGRQFLGADGVPLWGKWAIPPAAKGTVILNYGITGRSDRAWYAHTLARKVYALGWAVLLYDWRSHGKSAVLSPVPSADGWREGADQVYLAEQLVALGCPPMVALVGYSLGGQLVFWGLQEAVARRSPYIKFGATLSPNLESNRSLVYLRSSWLGRAIEDYLTRQLRHEAQLRQERFPEAVKPGAVERIDSIPAFDREMVIDYYGFASVEEYYQKTSGLYLLDRVQLPYLVVYAADDPMFDPTLVPEIEERVGDNPYGTLIMTQRGGHVCHIASRTRTSDPFWGLNRIVDYLERQYDTTSSANRQQATSNRE